MGNCPRRLKPLGSICLFGPISNRWNTRHWSRRPSNARSVSSSLPCNAVFCHRPTAFTGLASWPRVCTMLQTTRQRIPNRPSPTAEVVETTCWQAFPWHQAPPIPLMMRQPPRSMTPFRMKPCPAGAFGWGCILLRRALPLNPARCLASGRESVPPPSTFLARNSPCFPPRSLMSTRSMRAAKIPAYRSTWSLTIKANAQASPHASRRSLSRRTFGTILGLTFCSNGLGLRLCSSRRPVFVRNASRFAVDPNPRAAWTSRCRCNGMRSLNPPPPSSLAKASPRFA